MQCYMRRIIIIVLSLCVAAASLQARQRKDDNTKTAGYQYLCDNYSTYHRIQRHIFEYAEPGYQEFKSVAELSGHLKDNGFKIEMGIGGIPTAFSASFGSGHPVIALLGEYDALPGMSQDTVGHPKPIVEGAYGHACGHNILGTATVAASVAISKWLAQGHQGTVVFFGCPAEEGGGGKTYMTREGCFDGVDCVFDWHPGRVNEVAMDSWSNCINVIFTFKGIASHAGGYPWKGRSALDGVESFNYMMNMMREHVPDGTRIHYVINHGGEAPNIVPDFAQVNYYIRHEDVGVMMDVLERAKKAAEGAALGTGTTVSYEIMNGNYKKLINRHLAEVLIRNFNIVGGIKLDDREKALLHEVLVNSPEVEDKDGNQYFENVPKEVRPLRKNGGSSDVGSVSQVKPLATLRVAGFCQASSGHSWQCAALCGSTIGTKSMMTAAKVFYLSALDLYLNPSVVEEAINEYESVQGKDYKYIPLIGNREVPFDYRK